MSMIKLAGFAPDADPTAAGVLTDCENLIPYANGLCGAPTAQTPAGVPALAATCIGSAVIEKLDATRRTFAGTQSKLYELQSGAWADVSKAGDYTTAAEAAWSFAQFGDATLAANGADPIQRSGGSGAFASIASAPVANIVFSVGAFVMALGTSDGTYGTQMDRWWCCASFDESSWAPSVSTLATTARLVGVPGAITAGGRLGDYAIVYKRKAVFLGQYVGAPTVWDFIQIPGGEAGCVGKDAWCDIGTAHFLVGADNLYLFDGTRPQPVGAGVVRDWFYRTANNAMLHKTVCRFDRAANTVWVFFPSGASTTCDQALVYHVATQQWGRLALSIEAAVDYTEAGATIDGLDTYGASIDALSTSAIDSPRWLAGARNLAIINASHQLQTLTGSSAASSFVTGDIGDDAAVTLLGRLRLRFEPGYTPTSASVALSSKMAEGDSLSAGPGADMSDGHKFDVMACARYHRAGFSFTGPVRVLAFGADLKKAGQF